MSQSIAFIPWSNCLPSAVVVRSPYDILKGTEPTMSDNRVEIFMFRSLRSLLSARIAFLTLALTCLGASAQMNAPDSTSSDLQESAQSKIARALSAGPPNVTKNATVAEMGAQGQMKSSGREPMISRACREIQRHRITSDV